MDKKSDEKFLVIQSIVEANKQETYTEPNLKYYLEEYFNIA